MRKQTEDNLFRAYVTDSLKSIADNTARLVKDGVSLKLRYIEILDGIKSKEGLKESEETAEQIIDRISSGINNLGKGG